MYHMAHIALHTNRQDLLVAAGDRRFYRRNNSNDFYRARRELQQWASMPSAQLATWHAVQILLRYLSSSQGYHQDLYVSWSTYVATLVCFTYGNTSPLSISPSPDNNSINNANNSNGNNNNMVVVGGGGGGGRGGQGGQGQGQSDPSAEEDSQEGLGPVPVVWDLEQDMRAYLQVMNTDSWESLGRVRRAQKRRTQGLLAVVRNNMKLTRWGLVQEGLEILKRLGSKCG